MYVIFISIVSIAILCFVFAYCIWQEKRTNKKHHLDFKFVLGLIGEIILIVFPIFWFTNFFLFLKPLDYNSLKGNGVSVNHNEQVVVPMPQNIEDTFLLFSNRKEYILKFGEVIKQPKEAKPQKNWNKKEKKNDTIFNSPWKD